MRTGSGSAVGTLRLEAEIVTVRTLGPSLSTSAAPILRAFVLGGGGRRGINTAGDGGGGGKSRAASSRAWRGVVGPSNVGYESSTSGFGVTGRDDSESVLSSALLDEGSKGRGRFCAGLWRFSVRKLKTCDAR